MSRLSKPNSNTKYLPDEDLFDELYEIHKSLGHGGRDTMKNEVKGKFANITQEHKSYILVCELCQSRGESRKV